MILHQMFWAIAGAPVLVLGAGTDAPKPPPVSFQGPPTCTSLPRTSVLSGRRVNDLVVLVASIVHVDPPDPEEEEDPLDPDEDIRSWMHEIAHQEWPVHVGAGALMTITAYTLPLPRVSSGNILNLVGLKPKRRTDLSV